MEAKFVIDLGVSEYLRLFFIHSASAAGRPFAGKPSFYDSKLILI